MNNQRRRFRPRQQKNSFRRRSVSHQNNNGHFKNGSGNISFVSKNPVSIEKAIQRYEQLAKDALSAGDPILSENYFQHADHFSRKLKDLSSESKDTIQNKNNEKIKQDTENNVVQKIKDDKIKADNS
tara:strand:- start:360 stop:740 length:381 start_codon:yes stop_codon:yes gene_type:complete